MPTFCHNTGEAGFLLLVFNLSSAPLTLFVFGDDDGFVAGKPISYGFSARMRRLCLCAFVEIAAISLRRFDSPRAKPPAACNAAYRPETNTEHSGHRHPPFLRQRHRLDHAPRKVLFPPVADTVEIIRFRKRRE